MSSNGDTGETNGNRSARAIVGRGARARWWRRRGSKRRGFFYEDAKGQRIKDEAQLGRIRALVLPPAWTDVRISPSPNSKLQAVGIDTAGRIQYRYHAQFVARQQAKKYDKIVRFGHQLPSLRRLTNEHIALEGFPRERVLAIVIRLMNDLFFRVGSEASVKRYRTYGVTTLRNRHLEVKPGGKLIFSFVGKHHIRQRRILADEELAAVMRDLKALGGPKVFEYVGEDGRVHPVTPRHVNDYIKAATAPEFSAKDFRTWGGTLLAAMQLAEMSKPENEKQAKRNIILAIKRVAEYLGNTPTVCRKCYIHPAVFERYIDGLTLEEFRPKAERRISRLQPEYQLEELALLKLFSAGKEAVASSNGKSAEKTLSRQRAAAGS
ncbi:MAG TPA: DNA topoisomerase IB [Blastocatellia bacterium]|nr:DNA topoisomerase IB [Blastocatellia bacterium]